jgi:hypothetical protein
LNILAAVVEVTATKRSGVRTPWTTIQLQLKGLTHEICNTFLLF